MLRESEEQYRTVFEKYPVETIIVDNKGKVTRYNLTKKNSGDRLPAIGDVVYRDYGDKHKIDMYKELIDCIKNGNAKEFSECPYDDKFFHIRISLYSTGAIVTSIDITERKAAEFSIRKATEELQRLANLDELTLVANRCGFDRHLYQEWSRLRREKLLLSLILCDIDHFKSYNDTYSHQAGDRCLKTVARTINNHARRPGDLVARYRGDEFAVTLPNINAERAMGLTQAIREEVITSAIEHIGSS